MKRITMITAMLLLLGGGAALAVPEGEESYLYVVFDEGQPEKEINVGSLATLRSLTFGLSADARLLNVYAKDGAVQTFDLTTLQGLYFSPHASGMEQVEAALSTGKVFVRDGHLYVCGVEEGTPVALYATDGRMVKQCIYDGLPLSLEALPRGMYIVKAEGLTSKIVK